MKARWGLVLEAQLIPLQSLALRTRCGSPHGGPRPLEVVSPGRTESPAPAPKPARPPVLAAPNREAAITDVNIAMPQKPAQTPPALPVPNSATVPVLIRAVTDPRTASFETVSGQPVNIIALAAERSNARDVAIPKGFQNLPSSPAGDGERSGSERGDPALYRRVRGGQICLTIAATHV